MKITNKFSLKISVVGSQYSIFFLNFEKFVSDFAFNIEVEEEEEHE